MKRKDSRITKVESFASQFVLCSAEAECVCLCLYWMDRGLGLCLCLYTEKVVAVFSGKEEETGGVCLLFNRGFAK